MNRFLKRVLCALLLGLVRHCWDLASYNLEPCRYTYCNTMDLRHVYELVGGSESGKNENLQTAKTFILMRSARLELW